MSESLFHVVENDHGRMSIWPATRKIPAGWRAVLDGRTRDDCAEHIQTHWTSLNVKPVANHQKAMGFGIMFFGGDERHNARGKYEFMIQAARFADENDFKAIWLPERHFSQMGSLYASPAVLHAALSQQTKQIRLRAGSVVLPLNDPLRIAEEWAIVDNLSNGRVEVSFAPGWNSEDFALKPENYQDRYKVMYDGIRVVDRLWAGEKIETTSGTGETIQVRTFPTPIQKTLRKWITAAGSPKSFTQAGQIGADLLTHLFDQGIDELAEKIQLYRTARRENGFDADAGRVAVALHTYLAATMDDVHAKAHKPYCDYLKSNLGLLEKLAQNRGIEIDLKSLSEEQLDEAIEFIFEKFLKNRSLLGTPEQGLKVVKQLAEVGVDEIACLIDFGPSAESLLESLPHLLTLKSNWDKRTQGGLMKWP